MIRGLDPQLGFLLAVNVALLAVGAGISEGSFVSSYNLQSMAGQLPEIGFLAVGVMIAMASGNGGIDLSGIALANLAGVLAAVIAGGLVAAADDPALYSWTFMALALVIGLTGGVLNGILIASFRITPILSTLGTQMLFTGLAVVLSNGSAVTVGSPEPLASFGIETFLGVPLSLIAFIAVAAAVGLVLKFTPFGIQLMLAGSNPTAGHYAGFALGRITIITYAISGGLAGLAGILIAARNVNVKWDYGTSYLLVAILIVVMAGVKPEGGSGRVVNVVLSAAALQLLSSLLNFAGFSNFVRDFAWGVLLLVFLAAGRWNLLAWPRVRQRA